MKRRILVIAPHPDDEVLGVGGTIAKYANNGDEVYILTVAGHLPPLYKKEVYQQTVKEAEIAHRVMGATQSIFLDLPATTLGQIPTHELNGKICNVINDVAPHVVLCPYPDRHVDHRFVFETTMVGTRPVKVGKTIELVAAYEALSETHWNAAHIEPNFTPNWTVDITDYIDVKMKALSAYESQISPFPGPRSLEAVKALAIFRGTQAGFSYGESFHIIRMCT
jgi:LmbE family N-acetylglucosaminyl deacetylase